MIQEFLEKEAFRARGVAQESPAKLDPSVPRGKKVIPALQDSWGAKASWWVENFHRKQRQPSQIIKKLYRATRSFELPPQFSYTGGGNGVATAFCMKHQTRQCNGNLLFSFCSALPTPDHLGATEGQRGSETETERKTDMWACLELCRAAKTPPSVTDILHLLYAATTVI